MEERIEREQIKPFKTCLFCGTIVSGTAAHRRTKEHVVPKWLIDYLQIRDRMIGPTLKEIEQEEPVDARLHDLH